MGKTGLKLTDDQLITAASGGDQSAFFALWSRYHHSVSAHISKFVQGREDIEDICMESFEKAFKQIGTFRLGSRFSTWMFTIARNTAFDHADRDRLRSGKVETTSISASEDVAGNVPDEARSPEEAIIESQMHDKLVTSIEGLPDLYRHIAEDCFISNLGYKEIARKHDIALNTVKTRIRRAKAIIQEKMLQAEDE